MARFLSVKNFERYQHYKHRNPPWIKLYYDLLDDDDFISLSIESRHHYMTLLLIAGRKNNLIPYDLTYLKKVMRLDKEPNVSELITMKFLLATGKQRASVTLDKNHENRAQSISSSETETETETEAEGAAHAREAVKVGLDEFALTPDLDAWAVKEGILNPGQYVEEFKDYWRSTGMKRRNGQPVKDWPAAFRNWLRLLKSKGKLKAPDWREQFLREEVTT